MTFVPLASYSTAIFLKKKQVVVTEDIRVFQLPDKQSAMMEYLAINGDSNYTYTRLFG